MIPNKYTRLYFGIVSKAVKQNRKRLDNIQYQSHHIFPESLYPEFKAKSLHPWNQVLLDHREHFVCHWLLTKMFSDITSMKKMRHAFAMMSIRCKSGWRYNRAKSSQSEAMLGELNYQYGKKRPEHSTRMKVVMRGKVKSESHRTSISETWQASRERVTCTNCGMITTKGMHTRWHGDNCRVQLKEAA